MPNVHHVELFGSWGCQDMTTGVINDYTKRYMTLGNDPDTTKSPIPGLARKLLAQGLAAEDDIFRITRRESGMLVFKEEGSTVRWWADHDYVESRNQSLRLVKHRPFDRSVFNKSAKPAEG